MNHLTHSGTPLCPYEKRTSVQEVGVYDVTRPGRIALTANPGSGVVEAFQRRSPGVDGVAARENVRAS